MGVQIINKPEARSADIKRCAAFVPALRDSRLRQGCVGQAARISVVVPVKFAGRIQQIRRVIVKEPKTKNLEPLRVTLRPRHTFQ